MPPVVETLAATFDAILDALVREARRCYGQRLQSVAVFGSVGRGTMRADSDIDLLVVVDPLPDGRLPRIEEFAVVETAVAPLMERARTAGVDTRVSAVIRTRAEVRSGSPLMFDMTEDARLLYDPDDVLRRALVGLKRRLDALGARRIWLDGTWYWDLKPDFRPGETFELLTNRTLAASYLLKARKRLKALAVLLEEEAYSDVIREAQEIVELALKAALRLVGVDPPKIHDVGPLLAQHAARVPVTVRTDLPRVIEISAWLRKEREFAFYGDIDFIPTEQYSREQAQRAFDDAQFVVEVIERLRANE